MARQGKALKLTTLFVLQVLRVYISAWQSKWYLPIFIIKRIVYHLFSFWIETDFCEIIFSYSPATLQKRNDAKSEQVTQQHCMGTVSKASFLWYK